ncbi:unnamed protein product [Polarella glacialis]|uniref:J domain-containing protein n=2 Tax=Polarella glacialis TaxID=89957 RepID=A0A813DJK4_POLGL|nr:unnamed protein product [Polarella glacialis]
MTPLMRHAKRWDRSLLRLAFLLVAVAAVPVLGFGARMPRGFIFLDSCSLGAAGRGSFRSRLPTSRLQRSAVRDDDAEELLKADPSLAGNPFDLLKLKRSADKADVRPAFSKMSRILHPDVAGTGNAVLFSQVLWAYRELGDPDKFERWSQQPTKKRRRKEGKEAPRTMYSKVATLKEEMKRRDLVYDSEVFINEDDSMEQEDYDDGSEDALDDFEELMMGRKVTKEEKQQKEKQAVVVYQISGTYAALPHEEHHGRPVYRKISADGKMVAIYYWDERDGADCDGWWIGAEVGGDIVFAFNINQASLTPPVSGWRFPLRGPVDESLRINLQSSGTLEVTFD